MSGKKKTRRATPGGRPSVRIEEVRFERPVPLDVFVPGRLLAGWTSEAQGQVFAQTGANPERVGSVLEDIARARVTVRDLTRQLDQSGLTAPVPAVLKDLMEQFRATPIGQTAAQDGFDIAIVDIARVIAFQAYVRVPSIELANALLMPSDIRSVASLALSLQGQRQFSCSANPFRGSWSIDSADNNLQVIDAFREEKEPGVMAIGFKFAIRLSLLKVQRYHERWYLSDGYHRAAAMLRRGVRYAPALVRDVSALEDLGCIGHLPIDSFLGDRPPKVTDYFDDRVSVSLRVPGGPRRYLVQATQIA